MTQTVRQFLTAPIPTLAPVHSVLPPEPYPHFMIDAPRPPAPTPPRSPLIDLASFKTPWQSLFGRGSNITTG